MKCPECGAEIVRPWRGFVRKVKNVLIALLILWSAGWIALLILVIVLAHGDTGNAGARWIVGPIVSVALGIAIYLMPGKKA